MGAEFQFAKMNIKVDVAMRVCLNCTLKNGQDKKKSKQNKKNTESWGWHNGSAVKSIYCSLQRSHVWFLAHTR